MNSAELKQRIASLPSIIEGPPFTWQQRQWAIRQHVANDDHDKFLTWSTVTASMFVGNGAASVPIEYDKLTPRYRAIIEEPGVGQPETIIFDGITTSGNLIHQAYHLMQFEQNSTTELRKLDRIVEFGGGYGAMALLCRRLGFTGQYIIIDLPEMLFLQEFWLSHTVGMDNITLTESWRGRTDLLIAICSLSEVDIRTRRQVLGGLNTTHYLIRYQHRWDGLDNHQWFGQFEGTRFTDEVDTNHWYLIR